MSTHHTRQVRMVRPGYLRAAATMTEVVLTGALLLTATLVLAPAGRLAASRSQATTCLDNLRRLGVAIQMYTEVTKGVLPGPSSSAIHRYVTERSDPTEKARSLTWKLRTVLGDVIDNQAVTCPVAAVINPDRNFAEFQKQRGRQVPSTHYCLNNVPHSAPGGPDACYRTTDPQCYFGSCETPSLPPRSVEQIANPAKEWMVADAWYRSRTNSWPGLCQEGPFQSAWTGEALPNFAPHTNGVLRPFHFFPDLNERAVSSDQIRQARADGDTNTLFFDGHAGAVASQTLMLHGFDLLYGFRGTVNPADPPPNDATWQ